MARPNKYNFELCKNICELVANGQNIIKVLDSNNVFPSWSTFRRWKRDNEELRTLYINSVQDKAEAIEGEMDEYKEMLLAKEIDPATYNTLVQTLKWKMAKFYPKMFGDKIDLTSDNKPIQTNISILNIDPLSTNEETNNSTSEN